jgi:PAS domain-containing protein
MAPLCAIVMPKVVERIMHEGEILVEPAGLLTDVRRQVFECWLQNPFLDDDVAGISLRLGVPLVDVDEAVAHLSQAGLLRPAAGGGFALTVDLGGVTLPEDLFLPSQALVDEPIPADADADETAEDEARMTLDSLSGALEIETDDGIDEDAVIDLLPSGHRSEDLAREIAATLAALVPQEQLGDADLLDVMPFGVIVLQPNGALELANSEAARLLGLPLEDLDGATFEMATGVNPLTVLRAESSLSFSLTEPEPLEITLQPHRLSAGEVILIFVRDVALLEEVSRIQADVQEELYDRMRDEMVDPLAMIEEFLETPDSAGLVDARFAMEQINAFLRQHFISRRDSQEGQGPEPC